jgi:3-oxoacyl-[acyl-carrier-protein] synthase II
VSMKRVVITGMGVATPLGLGVESLYRSMAEGRSGITALPELGKIGGIRCRIGGKVPPLDAKQIPRKFRRSMSDMSVFAVLSSEEALDQAGIGPELCGSGRLGVSVGSTVGSGSANEEIFREYLTTQSIEQIKSTIFFKVMGHSCATNVSQALGITGRILAPSAACATSAQAIGYGYEMIAMGRQDFILCGGADELHPLTVGTFDIINAASIGFNDRPTLSPRPFDRLRDGTVCSEGSGIVLLESLDSALERGAKIYAELLGFATMVNTANLSNPDAASIEVCMRKALTDASMRPEAVDYVNAHATATVLGDVAESQAIATMFGDRVPVSGLKGYLGHSLAASGTVELIATIEMMNRKTLIPTLNLDDPDPECAGIRHVSGLEKAEVRVALKNNFALGGVNASIVIGRWEQ